MLLLEEKVLVIIQVLRHLTDGLMKYEGSINWIAAVFLLRIHVILPWRRVMSRDGCFPEGVGSFAAV